MRFLHGLSELATALDEAAVIHHESLVAGAGIVSVVMHENVVDTFGDASKLASLAQSTQDERTALGYSANDPLVRTGALLRDSVERFHEGTIAGVGSEEPILAYHEQGYVNARTGTSVPPRPVFKIGVAESEPEIIETVERAVHNTFALRLP